jgi:hypothetical protein
MRVREDDYGVSVCMRVCVCVQVNVCMCVCVCDEQVCECV